MANYEGGFADLGDVVAALVKEVRSLRSRINQPRTRIEIESWVITEDAAGNLIMRNSETGTTHTFDK